MRFFRQPRKIKNIKPETNKVLVTGAVISRKGHAPYRISYTYNGKDMKKKDKYTFNILVDMNTYVIIEHRNFRNEFLINDNKRHDIEIVYETNRVTLNTYKE